MLTLLNQIFNVKYHKFIHKNNLFFIKIYLTLATKDSYLIVIHGLLSETTNVADLP
jgi:hypothetical protein